MTLQWRAQLKRALIRSVMCLYAAVPVCGSGVEEPSRQQKIIVSLTSYPERFRYLHLTVKSLLLQTVKPDKIILYLGDDARDVPLPEALARLKKKGLSIEYRTGNLRSHKKYVYAMQEYPDDLVITVDDDMLYEPRLVARLLASYARYPDAVSARRVHRMAKKTDGTIAAYNDWEYECKTIVKPQMDLFPTTGSGVLFPAHCMDACVLDQELFMRECDAADDVWLKFMQLKKGTPTVYVPGPRFLELPGTQATSLSAENVDACRNDVFIQNLQTELGLQLGDFCTLVFDKNSRYSRLNG